MKQETCILVVDDDANLRKTLGDILRIKGYQAIIAGNGAEAIAAMAQAPISLALIDLMLPDMPGLEVMARIKAISPLTEAIILTGHASMDTAIEATKKGAFSYLVKPYQMDDLLLNIRHGIERQQAQEKILRLASYPRLDPNPVIEISSAGEVTYVNPAAEKLFPDLSAMGCRHPLLQGSEQLFAAFRQGESEQVVREVNLENATYEQHISYIREIDLIRIHALETTQRQQAQERLRLWASVFEKTVEGISICDQSGKIVSVNEAFSQMTGYSQEEALGQTHRLLQSGRHDQGFYQDMWMHILAEGQWEGEIWNRRKNGEVYPEWLKIISAHNEHDEVTHYISISSDVTERKKLDERLAHLVHDDALTGLPNRALLIDRLGQMIVGASRQDFHVGLLFINLDRFKNVNDSLGHAAGDLLLQKTAARIKKLVRAEDTLARMGGDEFIVLMPRVHKPEDVLVVAEKLTDSMQQPIEIEGRELLITMSIGMALFPDDGKTASDLIRNADAAMDKAKAEGGNNFMFYTENMNWEAFAALTMEQQLRKAVENGELLLHYQPQIDLMSGEIVGAEALLRWQHPEKGLVLPSLFVSIAEDRGLIVSIGEWVLQQACRQVAAWQHEGLRPIMVAVNVSAKQFQYSGFVQQVTDAIRAAGIEAKYLELELTESIVMKDAEMAINLLRTLHEKGLKLSIDDFGTGYSSLSYLRRFPLDKLKIDQSFIRDMDGDLQTNSIVRGIIFLAKSLKLRVIAEGVETLEQFNILRSMQCEEMQGYFYSKPVPAEEFAMLLRKGAPFKPPLTMP